MMTGTQRIKALLDGSPIDRTPIGGWYHMPLVDRNVTDFTRELIASTDLNKWDFIKIMTTGLLDFADHGKITGTPLSATDVKEMVHILSQYHDQRPLLHRGLRR